MVYGLLRAVSRGKLFSLLDLDDRKGDEDGYNSIDQRRHHKD